MKSYEMTTLGQHRGNPRLWLQGRKACSAGFNPGLRYNILKDAERKMLILEIDEEGSRVVSRKMIGEKEQPVIDINNGSDLAIFDGFAHVRIIAKKMRIIILPSAVELAKKERLARLRAKISQATALAVGSVSHGGGVLSHALHAGMTRAGVKARLAFANDIRPELLEHASVHNSAWDQDTVAIAAPLQQLALDAWAMDGLGKIEVLEAGLPCSGASVSGKAKNGAGHAEAHPEVGHLVVSFLAVIAKTQPAIVLLENVVPYRNSASMFLLRHQLRDLGYQVHETVLNAADWNVLERRERMCMVAATEGLELNFETLKRPAKVERKLSEIMDPIGPDDKSWSAMSYLVRKEERDKAKGSNFMMQIVSGESTHCPTITKGYAKIRSTDPKFRAPHDASLFRQFTLGEHARVKGIPESLVEGLGVTIGHELLGQSVCYQPFEAVGELLGNVLLEKTVAPVAPSNPVTTQIPRDYLAQSVLNTPLPKVKSPQPQQLDLII